MTEMASTTVTSAPRGVHLAGSTPLKSVYEHFSIIGSRLGPYLRSISDGEIEPAQRQDWAGCVLYAFKQTPWVLRPDLGALAEKEREISGLDILSDSDLPGFLERLRIGYDEWAITSYALFKQLKTQGVLPEHLKFQVGLPTLTSVCLFIIKAQYRTTFEPFIQAALVRALRNIQDSIPHDQLVIQFETVAEIFLFENVWKRKNIYGMGDDFSPWFGDNNELVRAGIMERFDRVINSRNIDGDVELGFHVCYGDSMNKHFVEPKDTGYIAEIIEHLISGADQQISYVHFPVPKERTDTSYLEPLRALWPKLLTSGTYLYIGLVHGGDQQGTRERIQAAKDMFGIDGWGIANECGLCRTPEAALEASLIMYGELANLWQQ